MEPSLTNLQEAAALEPTNKEVKETLVSMMAKYGKESQSFYENIDLVLQQRTGASLELKKEEAGKCLELIAETIYRAPVHPLCSILVDIGGIKAIDTFFAKLLQQLLKIPDEYIGTLEAKLAKGETTSENLQKTLGVVN